MGHSLLAWRSKRFQCIAIVLGLFALTLSASPAHAVEIRADQDTVRIGADETIDGDLFIAGQQIIVEGTINGDLFVFGRTIRIRGTVNGNVNVVAATSLLIEGPVERGVRTIGRGVTIAAPVGSDVIFWGQAVEVTDSGRVGGDIVLGGGDAILAGDVGRRVMGEADTLFLAANVGEGVDIVVDDLVIEPGARVYGDLWYRSQNEVQLPAGVVTGRVVHEEEETDSSAGALDAVREAIRGSAARIVGLGLLGLLLLTLAQGLVERAAMQIRQRPGASLLAGAVVGAVTVPAILIVGGIVLVVFGLVFGTGGAFVAILWLLAGLVFCALAIYMSPVFVALLIGRLLMGRFSIGARPAGFLALLVGLIVMEVLGAIPYVGWVVTGLATVLGLGGALLAGRDAAQPAGSS